MKIVLAVLILAIIIHGVSYTLRLPRHQIYSITHDLIRREFTQARFISLPFQMEDL